MESGVVVLDTLATGQDRAVVVTPDEESGQ